jgi:hypothetical protein
MTYLILIIICSLLFGISCLLAYRILIQDCSINDLKEKIIDAAEEYNDLLREKILLDEENSYLKLLKKIKIFKKDKN